MTRSARSRRVLFFLHPERPELAKRLRPLLSSLARAGFGPEVLPATPESDLAGMVRRIKPKLVVSIGGDGTILAAARALVGTSYPLLPVNLGGLGYLASAEGKDVGRAVRAALRGEGVRDSRRLMSVDISRSDRAFRRLGTAVNDATIRQGPTFRALRAELELDGNPLGMLLADGLVVATATGSTAYSLSAGGPVLLPGVDALVATPVCPHTLASRSLVFGEQQSLLARIVSRDEGTTLSLDGTAGLALARGDAVRFSLSSDRVTFLRLSHDRGLGALRSKLGWQGSPESRSP
ncbi:MAG TPA: NAD(+)/NADH kinase [Candidatus Eisenbacteria bacterium]|nr:NAD(+)/NADH kinase [Candidatus Eisenbacteria bacterium]